MTSSPWKQSRRQRSLVSLILFIAFISLLRCAGTPLLVLLPLALYSSIRLYFDSILGALAGWGIGKTPKAFRWTIARICVRPCFSWAPHAWSHIIIEDWTWHDPSDFDSKDGAGYILKIERLTLRLELGSIYRAFKRRKAINIDLMLLEGANFCTKRNEEALLNLWESLQIPDNDVNVHSILKQAKHQSGISEVAPLPAVATKATRQSAQYWRKEWGYRRQLSTGQKKCLPCCLPPCCCKTSDAQTSARKSSRLVYGRNIADFEYPIGDPRRRPRWGVPVRLDIRQLALLKVDLDIFDLLTMDKQQERETGETGFVVDSLYVSRDTLEHGDERRKGEGAVGDGVHGVYLGELLWVLIHQLAPHLAGSRLLYNAAYAAMYATRDSSVTCVARLLEGALDLGNCLRPPRHAAVESAYKCVLHVHLLMARGLSHKGKRANVHALLELREAPSSAGAPLELGSKAVDAHESRLKVWTKTPRWNEVFHLNGVSSAGSVLRVVLYHRPMRKCCLGSMDGGSDSLEAVGEVVLPLKQLLMKSDVIHSGSDMVGWFPLVGDFKHPHQTHGQIKLGLRLLHPELLSAV